MRRQPPGKRRTQGRNSGQALAQAVVQLHTQALLFPIGDLENFPLLPLLLSDIPSYGVDPLVCRHRPRVPAQPTVGAVLDMVTILEEHRLPAFGKLVDFRPCCLTVFRVYEVEEWLGLQLLQCPSKSGGPRLAQTLEVSVETGNAQQIERLGEKRTEIVLFLFCPCGQRFSLSDSSMSSALVNSS